MKISSIPQIYRHLNRWGEILSVLSKYELANWLSRLGPDFAKDLFKAPGGGALARLSWEARIRMAMAELGPTFIKLGQILSTRPDVVGVALADELQNLQANVPADPPEVVRATIENELGCPIEKRFAEFEEEAIASASIGQVHRGRLFSGEPVVVKVVHEGIERKVDVDLDILAGLALLAERLPEFQNYRPRATVAEFQRALRRELDFDRELRNMLEFSRNFKGDPTVHIPRAYPELSTRRMLTMERVEGIKLSQIDKHDGGRFDLAELARRGARLYLEMIFSHGFYHADPHPGNIMLLEGNVFGLLDYGMVGRIDDYLREDITELLLAITGQDADHLTSVIMRVGAVPTDLDRASLSLDVTDFVTHYGSQPLDQLNFGQALSEMTELIRRYHIMLPARIGMLLKVFITLDGTARLFSPTFSLIEVMKPYHRKLLFERFSPRRRLRKMRRLYAEIGHMLEALPRGIMDIFEQVESGKFDVHLDHRGLEPSVNRLVLGMLASALFLGSSLLLSRDVPPLLFGKISAFGISGCTIAILLGLRLLRAINKSGHLDRRK